MNQDNYGGKNYQIQTGKDNTNFIGGEHYHYHLPTQSATDENSLETTNDECSLLAEKIVPQTFWFNYATVEAQPSGILGYQRQPKISYHRKRAKYFSEDLGGGLELEMIAISSGSFLMGSSVKKKGSSTSEHPLHKVNVQPFFISKYPVTQAQWKALALAPQITRFLELKPSKFEGDNHPVEQVSWDEAVEFCNRLSRKTSRKYRLPSEVEWEYSCRAGTSSIFHFGETITPELVNFKSTNISKSKCKEAIRQQTTPVGSFKVANSFGLYDMHGNVWEWCVDQWCGNYCKVTKNNEGSTTNENNQFRVIRGGSWADCLLGCRSACRKKARRDEKGDYLGFRIACSFE